MRSQYYVSVRGPFHAKLQTYAKREGVAMAKIVDDVIRRALDEMVTQPPKG